MNLASSIFCVGLGGALGACSRYAVGLWLYRENPGIPLGSLSVNVLGSFIAGFLTIMLMHKGSLGSTVQLVFMVGFLGAFTTFSAFSVETLYLYESGNIASAGLNIVLNVLGALVAVFVGAALAQSTVVG